MKRLWLYCPFILSLMLLTACAQAPLPSDMRWASVQGGQIEKSDAGEEFFFTVPVDKSMLDPQAIPINMKVSGNVTRGSLRFELRNPGGQAVWNSGTIGPGDFSIKANYVPGRDQAGEYKLGLMYSGSTSARYDLSWHALKLGPAVLVPGAGMLLVGLAFLTYGAWRRLGWRYFGLGALFWIVTVAAKFVFAILVSPGIYQLLNLSRTNLSAPGNLVAYVYIGSLTGLFEVGLAWMILRKIRWGRACWEQALAFGIGFGVIEALLLGLSSLVSGIAGLFAPGSLPVPALGSLARSANLLMIPAPVVERLFVILAHIFACVLIFYAIAKGEKRWVWWAILYKTILDTPAGFAAFWNIATPDKLWTIEVIVAVVGLVGLWGTVMIAKRYPREEAAGV
jgi:uncharacterized membrane protein YhfC